MVANGTILVHGKTMVLRLKTQENVGEI